MPRKQLKLRNIKEIKEIKHHFRRPVIKKRLFCKGLLFNEVNVNKAFYMYQQTEHPNKFPSH